MRRSYACVVAWIVLCGPGWAGQEPASPAAKTDPGLSLTILAFGGLLGQIDGFYEHWPGRYFGPVPGLDPPPGACPMLPAEVVGSSRRRPVGRLDADEYMQSGPSLYGGLAGLAEELKKRPRPTLVLVTGDNSPFDLPLRAGVGSRGSDLFWRYFRQELPPDIRETMVVGLGAEDFLRAVKGPGDAARLRQELLDLRMPIVSSNAVIREKRKNLNVVARDGLTLAVPRDESVGLLTELKLEAATRWFGRGLELFDEGDPWREDPAAPQVTIASQDYGRTRTLTLSQPLRPGRQYSISPEGSRETRLYFRTVRMLTPWGGAGPLHGAPVVERSVTVNRDTLSIVVLSLIDPDTRKLGSLDAWGWPRPGAPGEPAPAGAAYCEAGTCEIDFLPPAAAVAAIRAWAGQKPGSRGSLFALISALADTQVSEVLEAAPEIRFVAFPPDTGLLGRAAAPVTVAAERDAEVRRRDSGSYESRVIREKMSEHAGRRPEQEVTYWSGDLGYSAVLNPGRSGVSQVWVRPEWVGETLHTITATLSAGEDTWAIEEPRVDTKYVCGKELQYEIRQGNSPTVDYFIEGDPQPVGTGFPLYPPYGEFIPYDGRHPQYELWTDRTETMALLADVARRALQADAAILPVSYVDPDVADWLADLEEHEQPIDFLSRFLLERAMFRSGRIVPVEVQGTELKTILSKILARGSELGEDYCVAGLGAFACELEKIADGAKVDGRHIEPTQFYRVAMPQSTADDQALRYTASDVFFLVDRVDEEFRYSDKPIPADTRHRSLSALLDEERRQRVRTYMDLSAVEAAFSLVRPREPDAGKGFFAEGVPEGRKAKEELKIDLNASGDVAWDLERFAIRTVNRIKFSWNEVQRELSLSENEFEIGPRAEWKITQSPLRLFVGGLFEGNVKGVRQTLTPTTKETIADGEVAGLTREETLTGQAVTVRYPRRMFIAANAGFEARAIPGVKRFMARVDFGRWTNMPVAVPLNGERIPMNEFASVRGRAAVNERFTANPAAFAVAHTVVPEVETVNRARLQLDSDLERGFTSWRGGKPKLTATIRFRWYPESEEPALSTKLSTEIDTGAELPLFSRIVFKPTVTYYTATLRGVEGRFGFWKAGARIAMPIFVRLGRGTTWR